MTKLEKSPDAYRTISEVSDQLDVPQHVLRFWESKFPQIAPMKRAGNRRYYDPAHIGLLSRIRDLLYVEGYTTKGVQKLLEEGRLMEGVETDIPPQPTGPSANLMDLTAAQPGAASPPLAPPKLAGARDEALAAISNRLKAAKERLESALKSTG